MIRKRLIWLLGLFFIADSRSVWACAVCFGDPNSLQTKGLNYAIIFLLIVTAGVMASIVSIALSIWRRAKHLKANH